MLTQALRRALISATANALLAFLITLPMGIPSASDIYTSFRIALIVFIYKLATDLKVELIVRPKVVEELKEDENGREERHHRRAPRKRIRNRGDWN